MCVCTSLLCYQYSYNRIHPSSLLRGVTSSEGGVTCKIMFFEKMNVLVVVFVLGFTFVSANYKGHFQTQEGSSCEWEEQKYDNNYRSLLLNCFCTDYNDKRHHYSCEYFGNPFSCELFDKRGGTERFYHQMVEHIRGM